MKKTMMAMMAAAMMLTTGTALAAAPGEGNLQDGMSRIEANNAYCGGGYCWGNENSNEG